MERDNYMSAADAKIYGIVDEVVKSRREVAEITGESK
jgi:ATP-dependent protease ClpP protease subunit